MPAQSQQGYCSMSIVSYIQDQMLTERLCQHSVLVVYETEPEPEP